MERNSEETCPINIKLTHQHPSTKRRGTSRRNDEKKEYGKHDKTRQTERKRGETQQWMKEILLCLTLVALNPRRGDTQIVCVGAGEQRPLYVAVCLDSINFYNSSKHIRIRSHTGSDSTMNFV